MSQPDQAPSDGITRRMLLGMTAAMSGALVSPGLAAAASAKATSWHTLVKIIPEPPQAPAQEGYIDVNGARLWYWDTGGKGEVIVLLHPATGSGAVWCYQQPVFAKAGYRVIAYSRRGYFKSQVVDPKVTSLDTEDLQQLVQQLGLKRFHLVGSAAGTFIAAQYAVTHPENLLSAVLSSSLINIQDEDYRALTSRMMSPAFNALGAEYRELGPSYRAANPAGTARWLEIEKASRTGELPGPAAGGPSGGPPQGPPTATPGVSPMRGPAVTFENLGAIQVPLLLMTGDCDLFAPPPVMGYVADKLKKELTVIENAGHAAHWEQSDAFNKAVLDFIRQHRA